MPSRSEAGARHLARLTDEQWKAERAAANRRLCGSAEGSDIAAVHAEMAQLCQQLRRTRARVSLL